MPHSRNRTWLDIQKKMAGFHHPSMRNDHDAGWVPNSDIIEHGDGLLIRIELAGIDHETLEVILTESAMLVNGIRPNPHTGGTAAGYRFRQMEIEYGPFERVLPLPYPIDRKLARARSVNGMLEIHLPRAVSVTRRKTVVQIKW